MKAKVLELSFVFLVILSISCWGQSTDKIVFGIQIDGEPFNELSSGKIDSLHNYLGFNLAYTCDLNGRITMNRMTDFEGEGFDVIPYMMDSTDINSITAFRTYLNAHYMVMTTKDVNSSTRFFVRNGFTDPLDSNWFVAPDSFINGNPVSFIFLDSLWYDHEKEYLSNTINYQPYLHMRIDAVNVPSNDTVAILNIWTGDQYGWESHNKHYQLVRTDTIYTNGFQPNTARGIFLSDFPISSNWPSGTLTYQLVSTGKYQFAIDSFKVSDPNGEDIMVGRYDSTFSRYARENKDSVFCWQLRDDMKYDQLLTTRHLEKIIADSTYMQQRGMIKPWLGPYYIDDFLDMAKPARFWINQYPFWDRYCSDTTTYGLRTDYCGNYTGACSRGLQVAIDSLITHPLDTLMAAIGAPYNDTIELWYTAQLQAQEPDNENAWGYEHRRPSGSEMSMEAFVALSYGIKRLQYWPYKSYHYGGFYFDGLVDTSNNYTVAWDNLEQYVTRPLQALDEYLADSHFIWDRSYDSHHIGSGLISSVNCWSDSLNPDVGWAQIGEFHNDTSGVKYILLVNRACSTDSVTFQKAPPQHFTIKFNRDNLGLEDYVLITDLADTVIYNNGSHHWDGVQRTTYSATMPDGTIPYTVTLRAGEGKLIKITPANN